MRWLNPPRLLTCLSSTGPEPWPPWESSQRSVESLRESVRPNEGKRLHGESRTVGGWAARLACGACTVYVSGMMNRAGVPKTMNSNAPERAEGKDVGYLMVWLFRYAQWLHGALFLGHHDASYARPRRAGASHGSFRTRSVVARDGWAARLAIRVQEALLADSLVRQTWRPFSSWARSRKWATATVATRASRHETFPSRLMSRRQAAWRRTRSRGVSSADLNHC